MVEGKALGLATAAAFGGFLVILTQRLIAVARRKPDDRTSEDGSATDAGHPLLPLFGQQPHPGWEPPQPLPPPFDSSKIHSLDPSTLTADVLYPLVISAVVPRPIAFVSTLGADGSRNLAPYSYFNVLAHDPPTVAIGCCASGLRPHGRKDTLVNILQTREFVVNIISEWYVEAANHCCGNFDYDEDEMLLSGLHPAACSRVAPPRVAEAALALECRLAATHEVKNRSGKVTSTIVIGEVVMVHVAEAVAGRSPSGKLVVDVAALRPMSRLGGNYYGRTAGVFELPRPDRDAGRANRPLTYTSSPA